MTTLTTKLDAINLMLSIIGEAPVNSVDDTGIVDAALAKQVFDETNREVQSHGWHWNTDRGYSLAATNDGEVLLPSNTLRVDAVDTTLDVVQRGNRLWDRVNHTYDIGRAVLVDIVRLLDFEEIPETARAYIAVRSGRKFQDRVVGSEVLSGFNKADEQRAWVILQNHEAANADYNMRVSVPVRSVLSRRAHGGF
ncbi:phage tail protein [Pyruvatibacter mobilis]|uniref:Phage tail protein n=1 Tax=Pyruvatibacter mobilis TaxID=1712261 RepID=A0A845Q7Y5_9HYPH|nr:phage tail protein [Pyruvatibacter mobilis]NBG94499.1 phage tail protein [Pyruvatibacter mobilis]QJD74019.1 phage tail protein [Pyruvatibacter mobilis]GGD03432.1 hypothetical protein GCM10011587_03950 [Pyruvatibacter mobilis]